MNFYTRQHKYYCGIDLHARKMYVCVLNQQGDVKLHKNIDTDPALFLELIAPYQEDVIVGVECVFCWYWLADLCASMQLFFILGHALYMRAIHGGKTKNDKIDSYKIASLLKGGNFPVADSYPAEWRATRDLLRRRMYIAGSSGKWIHGHENGLKKDMARDRLFVVEANTILTRGHMPCPRPYFPCLQYSRCQISIFNLSGQHDYISKQK